jgi:hypothetical protein
MASPQEVVTAHWTVSTPAVGKLTVIDCVPCPLVMLPDSPELTLITGGAGGGVGIDVGRGAGVFQHVICRYCRSLSVPVPDDGTGSGLCNNQVGRAARSAGNTVISDHDKLYGSGRSAAAAERNLYFILLFAADFSIIYNSVNVN